MVQIIFTIVIFTMIILLLLDPYSYDYARSYYRQTQDNSDSRGL